LHTANAPPRQIQALEALVLFGGLRPKEALRAVDHIHDEKIDLPADKTKNNKRRLIELKDVPTCWEWLKRYPNANPINLRKRRRAVLDKAGLKWSPDILRHSFVSYAVKTHGVAAANLLAEHSESIMRNHYRELVTQEDAEKFWRILPK
jgi:hypothetical protein